MGNLEEQQYLNLLKDILDNGTEKIDRTGTGTLSVFSRQLRFDLSKGFPLLTTKKVHFKSIAVELLWFLKGLTNTKYLEDNMVTIWREWQDENGDLGPIYSKQWRDFGGVDQISAVIESIKTNPDSRRHLVSAWNPIDLNEMALPPCHYSFQFVVTNGKLNCIFNMRSSDTFLGLPFNIASYALLTHIIALETGLQVGELVYSGADVHIYKNHINAVKEQLTRTPYPFPQLTIKTKKPFDQYEYEDFLLTNYQSHPRIKAEVAI